MNRRINLILLFLSILTAIPAHAQSPPGYGWSSFGVLPFPGYDYVIVKAPTRYILYYTRHSTTTLAETGTDSKGRAFSTDLKNWTVDTGDICATSGDFCIGQRTGVLVLPDGRMRMFFNPDGKSLISSISTDGVTWTREAGTRYTVDPNSIFERGPFSLELTTFVNLPDGSVRMYYEGGITPHSTGTPAYYNDDISFNGVLLTPNGAILSATSKDNGLTWTREPGVRINPLVQGPVNVLTLLDGTVHTQIDATDLTAVAIPELGHIMYRIYAPSWADGTVSYVSNDGLNFVLEGQIPADRGDAKAVVMADGRVWLVTNQYPDAINDTIVYGPQSLFLSSARASVTLPPFSDPSPFKTDHFKSVAMGITGTSTGPVTLEATAVINASQCADVCGSNTSYYSFSPASGTPPFTTVLSFTGPSNYVGEQVLVHAKSAGATAVGISYCMNQSMDRSDTSVFCKSSAAALPMNQMKFAFSPGGAASSQVSSILSLGGPGYPFTVSSSVPWATVSPSSGVAPMPITVKVDPAGLAAGTYNGIVTITAEGTTELIAVTATVSAAPVITAIVNTGSGAPSTTPNSFLTIYGNGFTPSAVTWDPVTTLPTTLGGVSVQVNGKPAFISYAGPSQLNILLPADTASGTVPVAINTGSGPASSTISLAPSAPSWFTYNVTGPTWIAALIANTKIYVAPAGSLGAQASQSAKAGDYLQLYANGLGNTVLPPPSGTVLTSAYTIDDLSRLRLTIGGVEVPVLYAGLTEAGLYQINVQVPSGLGAGEFPVVLFVDGLPTQGATLNFQ
ncbi:MAG TPA: hypothetical protein VG273_08140 [Bryobacteraceae bacterium]|jgi:uncharacterized protein (TIGR03437 family)|nr:hypothetical protein [Bryobacteraceae bacterium]